MKPAFIKDTKVCPINTTISGLELPLAGPPNMMIHHSTSHDLPIFKTEKMDSGFTLP